MGYETRCAVVTRGADGAARSGTVSVLIETDELIVRGEPRARVPRDRIERITVRAGTVTVRHADGTIVLTLGSAADAWAARLAAPPKSLLDKLGITSGLTVAVLGAADDGFLADLAARAGRILRDRVTASCDVVILGIERDADLARIGRVARRLPPTAALWVVHPKGPHGIPDTAIFGAARTAGLTYTKVARFSATHTAEKLVVPRARR
jgi:hypothetical protein